MDPEDTPAPQLPAITNGELGEPTTENEGTKAEAADSEAELRFRLTEKQKEPVVCYDCRTNQDPSNCQRQGKPNNPKYLCNACNRRNTKFQQVLRQCPKMATMWGDMAKEKKEIKDALSADDEGDMKEAMLKQFATMKVTSSKDTKNREAKPLPLSILATMGYSTEELENIKRLGGARKRPELIFSFVFVFCFIWRRDSWPTLCVLFPADPIHSQSA